MKLKILMMGLLPLLSHSHGVLADKFVGACPLPTEFVITSDSLKFEGIPQPKSFSSAYFVGGIVVCMYGTLKLSTPVTGTNCKMVSKNGSTAAACQAPTVATDCKIFCD